MNYSHEPSEENTLIPARPPADYRFEYGGLLVYDIKGANSSVSATPPLQIETPPKFSNKELKLLHASKVQDYKESLLLKQYPPHPTYPIDYYYRVPPDSTTLEFNSKFESGNLSKAVKMSDYEYKLLINNDIGTYCCNHWFYFSVKNPRKTTVSFQIVNMRKKDILYQAGMKPAVYSERHYKETGIKWHRDCTNVIYSQNFDKKDLNHKAYTLSFTYSFRYENDIVFFAYAYPYTTTDLNDYLSSISEASSGILRINELCTTLAGNSCKMLTITEGIKDYFPYSCEKKLWNISGNNRKKVLNKILSDLRKNKETYNETRHQNKFGVVLMARVHSGETVGSFMMRGAIDYLISSDSGARYLRKCCVFKIIPMLNPDGVVYGNYRTSLLGVDLNRRWLKPHKLLHPTIYYSRVMIDTFKLLHDIKLLCDMHGHTKKFNVFMYGCCSKNVDLIDARRNLQARMIPYKLYRTNRYFSLKDSHFRIEDYKASTARVVFYEHFGISHSYTLEASFFGYLKSKQPTHFTEAHLESLGRDLCKACIGFTSNKRYSAWALETNNYLRSLAFANCETKFLNSEALLEGLKVEESASGENSREIADELKIDEEVTEEPEDVFTEPELECEAWWEIVDVVEVQPDSISSGSESEISDDEVVVYSKEEKKATKDTHFSTQSMPPKRTDRKVAKIEFSVKKNFNSKTIITARPVRNHESLGVNVFNFPIDSSDVVSNRKSFESYKYKCKAGESQRPSKKMAKSQGRHSFLFPKISQNNLSTIFTTKKTFNSNVINNVSNYLKNSTHFQGKQRNQ